MLLSIIIPTYNEEKALPETLRILQALPEQVEILVADGGSTDATAQIAKDMGAQVIESPRGRGIQMNTAATVATGKILLFLHADTHAPQSAIVSITKALSDDAVCGGHFSLRFSGPSRDAKLLKHLPPLLKFFGMCYGDRGIFVRAHTFREMGGYKPIPLFEDYDLYTRLKKIGRFVQLPDTTTTSSRRFEGRLYRTLALWLTFQFLYWLGASPHRLANLYRHAR